MTHPAHMWHRFRQYKRDNRRREHMQCQREQRKQQKQILRLLRLRLVFHKQYGCDDVTQRQAAECLLWWSLHSFTDETGKEHSTNPQQVSSFIMSCFLSFFTNYMQLIFVVVCLRAAGNICNVTWQKLTKRLENWTANRDRSTIAFISVTAYMHLSAMVICASTWGDSICHMVCKASTT